jgi:hypothetical protein
MQLTHTKRSLLPIIAIVAAALTATMVMTATARNSSNINITIGNNSQREIPHVYLAVGDPNNWGPDQLNNSTIPPGGTRVLSDVACSGSIRVIAEDQDGCFVYKVVSCDANQTWEITNSTPRDCGD